MYLQAVAKYLNYPIAALLAFALLALAASASATPLLRCEVTYAGAPQLIETRIQHDPYAIAAVDIAERFKFKALMIGEGERIDYIKLYAYYQGSVKDVLLQEVKYLPPFATSQRPDGLTGMQYVYSSGLERELQYHCALLAQ